MKFTLLISIFFAGSELVKCGDILAVIPSPFFSHQATFRPLWRELAKRGHSITLITTHPMEPNENITQLDIGEAFNKTVKQSLLKNSSVFSSIRKYLSLVDEFMTNQFTHPDLQELIRTKRTFDLMLVELIMPGWPLLSVKFKCPFIGLSTMDGHQMMHNVVGNAIHPVIYPYADLGIGENPSIMDKFKSIGFNLMNELFQILTSPVADYYLRKYVDKDLPGIREVLRNTSMIIINSNPIFFPPRPVTPVTINLGGGLHLTKPEDLPQDLQTYLDNAKHGCIYVSFGTTVNSEYLSKEQKDTIVQVFADMAPMKILWKFDDINVAKDVKNVEVRNWVPQQDVLRHPNIKLFITQGGLQSMEEAIDSGVPMLGMPFYGDQFNNVLKMDAKKFGLKLHIKDMTRETLKSSLDELLKNPIYKKNIDKYSAISKDQPMKGLDKAVWWTEYVLRHGGTEHLRSPSADIPLYQYYFLDVIAVSIIVIWLFVKIMKYVFRFIHKLIFKYITYPLLYKPKTKKE